MLISQVTADEVLSDPATARLIEAGLDEDLGTVGDLTARVAAPTGTLRASVVARQAGTLAGLVLIDPILAAARRRLGGRIERMTLHAGDGGTCEAGQRVATIQGDAGLILSAERTLLNVLGRMSGVASHTARHVAAARGGNPGVQVLDTRKTLPGWRLLDKYAVTCGGGTNHRRGLYDAVLVKDNHLAGLVGDGLRARLEEIVAARPVEAGFLQVEVDTLAQFGVALGVAGIDIILLDNFALDDLRAAVTTRDQRDSEVLLEASGGVTLETIAAIAGTGVDRISVGALTHSAVNFDFGLDVASEQVSK